MMIDSDDWLELLEKTTLEFDQAWQQSGENLSPLLPFYLHRSAALDADQQRQLFSSLLKVELEVRQKKGPHPGIAQYVERFPQFSALVICHFCEFPELLPLLETAANGDRKAPAPQQPICSFNLGRHNILGCLGAGSFGAVFLSWDTVLHRHTAIKFPRLNKIQAGDFLREARSAARLKHESLIKVFDVVPLDDACFIVMDYVDGGSLDLRIAAGSISLRQAAEFMLQIARALEMIHDAGLIHRDLKTSNILLDRQGRTFVTDFGLAISYDRLSYAPPECAGTLAYMPPEQLDGSADHQDFQTDIWALGVVFYELLTGRRPFHNEDQQSLVRSICHDPPRRPRDLVPAIPEEFETICLKCLDKDRSRRYSSASEVVKELEYWADMRVVDVMSTDSAERVPKGLNSFDHQDADFYLQLVPGPRNEQGLPKSISTWKARIETAPRSCDAPLGVIVGPSGSGKSSFVKAGLLPRLDPNIDVIYLEATHQETERWLHRQLREEFPQLPQKLDLKASVTQLVQQAKRRGHRKLLIVIDQFEQYLQGRGFDDSQLAAALHGCDGVHVQCLLVARDDFWTPLNRFVEAAGFSLNPKTNFSNIDLPNRQEATSILEQLGRSHGAISKHENLSQDQSDFLDEAISLLVDADRVNCARLTLLAEVLRDSPWTLETLKCLGGATGIGLRFLDQKFEGADKSRPYRQHEDAAHAILHELLPISGDRAASQIRSHGELQQVSGYDESSFSDLLDLLENKLKLIAPACGEQPSGHRYYRLTHDSLVESLRQWLTYKQQQTAQGRAKRTLVERSGHWSRRQDRKQLPSFGEWIKIWCLTQQKTWISQHRKMMKAATVRYVSIMLTITVLLTGFTWTGREAFNHYHAARMVDSLGTMATVDVADGIGKITPYEHWAIPRIKFLFEDSQDDSKQQLHFALALVDHETRVQEIVIRQVLLADPVVFDAICEVLRSCRSLPKMTGHLQEVLKDPRAQGSFRLRAACALTTLRSDKQCFDSASIVDAIVSQLMSERPSDAYQWISRLQGIQNLLIPKLEQIFQSDPRSSVRQIAAAALCKYLGMQNKSQELVNLALNSDIEHLSTFAPTLRSHGSASRIVRDMIDDEREAIQSTHDASSTLRHSLFQSPKILSQAKQDHAARRVARLALLLFQIEGDSLRSEGDYWSLFQPSADPKIYFLIQDGLARSSVDLNECLQVIQRDTNPFVVGGFLLALAHYPTLPIDLQKDLNAAAEMHFRTSESPYVHSAAEYFLRRWNREGLDVAFSSLETTPHPGNQRWFRTRNHYTMVVLDGTVFPMKMHHNNSGTPMNSEPSNDAQPIAVRIPRVIAVATKETTVRQYQMFDPRFRPNVRYCPQADCPVLDIPLSAAMAYCNWLSKVEGLEPCYECTSTDGSHAVHWRPRENHLQLTGYRLPTSAENALFTRADAAPARRYGYAPELLPQYVWYHRNSDVQSHSVGTLKPNLLGIYDSLGNAAEWCIPITRVQQTFPLLDDGAFNSSRIIFRGAHFNTPEHSVSTHFELDLPAANSTRFATGFRIVRTVKKK